MVSRSGARVARTEVRVLGEQRKDEGVHVARDPPSRRFAARRLGVADEAARGSASSRPSVAKAGLPGDELVHHQSEGIDVGARAVGQAAELLGGEPLAPAPTVTRASALRPLRVRPAKGGVERRSRSVLRSTSPTRRPLEPPDADDAADEDVLEAERAVDVLRRVKGDEGLQDRREEWGGAR